MKILTSPGVAAGAVSRQPALARLLSEFGDDFLGQYEVFREAGNVRFTNDADGVRGGKEVYQPITMAVLQSYFWSGGNAEGLTHENASSVGSDRMRRILCNGLRATIGCLGLVG